MLETLGYKGGIAREALDIPFVFSRCRSLERIIIRKQQLIRKFDDAQPAVHASAEREADITAQQVRRGEGSA
jgi:hypothetical protein